MMGAFLILSYNYTILSCPIPILTTYCSQRTETGHGKSSKGVTSFQGHNRKEMNINLECVSQTGPKWFLGDQSVHVAMATSEAWSLCRLGFTVCVQLVNSMHSTRYT